jgi:ketosteroid isomerase-like protein
MNNRLCWQPAFLTAFLLLCSCTCDEPPAPDLIGDTFPDAQAELRLAVKSIVNDAMTANIEGLQAAHLVSDKFTKFGPRSFERQDVASANASEAAFFSSISDLEYETRDLQVDVFEDVGIATYYPHVSFVQDGEEKRASGRQTLVFLKTGEGWKIVHEHGTPRPD